MRIELGTIPLGYSNTVAELHPATVEAIKAADRAMAERRRAEAVSVATARATKLRSAKAARRLGKALKLFGGR